MARKPKASVGEIVDNDPLGVNEVADIVAAGAINGAGAALDAGGDARDVAAAAIGGAAAATEEALNVEGDGTAEQLPPAEDTANAEPIPPAPGDDPASVFDRRVERLTNLVAEAKFESGTAFGDIRDVVLDQFKHAPKLWSAMLADERKTMTRHAETVARDILRKVVQVIAEEDSHSIGATVLAAFAVKGESVEIKAKVEQVDADALLDIFKLAGHRVVIISADDKRFASARKEVDIPADQLGLEFAGSAKAPAEIRTAPPTDDSDLIGDDTGTHHVFDAETDGGLYLMPDKTNWTDKVAEAGAWNIAQAEALAVEVEAAAVPIPEAEPEEPAADVDGEDDDPPLIDDENAMHDGDSAIDD